MDLNYFGNIAAERANQLLSIYGNNSNADIVKSEDAVTDEPVEEKIAGEITKSEHFSILESIASGDILKSVSETFDAKKEKKESEETAPETGKENGEGNEKEIEEKSIKKGIENLIEKGELTDKIAYGYGGASEAFKFVKTGAQIKEKLPTIIAVLEMEKATLIAQLTNIQGTIGIAPTRKMQTSFTKDIALSDYPYEMCDAPYDEVLRKYGTPTDQNLLCSKYNSLAYVCRNVCEDIMTAQTVLANVEDKKTYTLSVNQLVALGFTEAPIQKSEGWNVIEANHEDGLNDFLKSQQSRVLSMYGGQDIEKGGEGSKGGKVIGHTKSGKAIYDTASHSGHKDFTVDDHNDAYDAHKKKLKDGKHKADSKEEKHHLAQLDHHAKHIVDEI
jgi:hypothetical protein